MADLRHEPTFTTAQILADERLALSPRVSSCRKQPQKVAAETRIELLGSANSSRLARIYTLRIPRHWG